MSPMTRSVILIVGNLLLTLWLSTPATAQRWVTLGDVTVTGASTSVAVADSARIALLCTNTNATVHVRWGPSTVTATSGNQLRATGTLSLTGIDATAALSMISEGTNVTVSCTELRL